MSVQSRNGRSRLAMATIGSVSLALLSGCVALQKGQSEDDDLPFLPPPTLEKPLPPVPQPTLSQIPGYEEAAPQLAAAEGAEIEPTPVPRAPLAEDCEAVAGSSFSECPMD